VAGDGQHDVIAPVGVMGERPTYEFFLWRGERRVGTLHFDTDFRATKGMCLALLDAAEDVSDLMSVSQVYSDGRAFEQDGEPLVPKRPTKGGSGTGNTFALRGMDRIAEPDRKYTIRAADGTVVTLRMLSLTEIRLPADWHDASVGRWAADQFENGRAWEVMVIVDDELPGRKG